MSYKRESANPENKSATCTASALTPDPEVDKGEFVGKFVKTSPEVDRGEFVGKFVSSTVLFLVGSGGDRIVNE